MFFASLYPRTKQWARHVARTQRRQEN